MVSLEFTTAMTHVVSQILGRWLPPPKKFNDEDLPSLQRATRGWNFEDSCLDESCWLEILEADVSSFTPVMPWLADILSSRRLTLCDMARAASRHFLDLKQSGGTYICIHSFHYPSWLRHIARPPLGLSVLGNQRVLNGCNLAVIGSRRTSSQALRMSVEVGVECAEAGVTVVSGGAIGCDIAVHEGVLVGSTDEVAAVVVQASGLSNLFPRVNNHIFSEIVARGGAVISERLWFQEARPHDFPARNRIVSGMSQATVVMAAALKSGSLITANETLLQGRDVYVFSGDPDDVRFEGSRELLSEGATPFFTAEDLIQSLSLNYELATNSKEGSFSSYCQDVEEVGNVMTEP